MDGLHSGQWSEVPGLALPSVAPLFDGVNICTFEVNSWYGTGDDVIKQQDRN